MIVDTVFQYIIKSVKEDHSDEKYWEIEKIVIDRGFNYKIIYKDKKIEEKQFLADNNNKEKELNDSEKMM